MKVIKIRLGLIRCKQLETAYEENKKYQILLIHISSFVSLFSVEHALIKHTHRRKKKHFRSVYCIRHLVAQQLVPIISVSNCYCML